MVDAVVSFVVTKLGDFLIKEAVFLHGVRDEVQRLRDELRYMQRFLQDAEEKQYGDAATLREWVSDMRELAYDIEDLFDTFHLKAQRKPGCFSSVSSCISDGGNLYNIGKEVEEFNNRLDDLTRRRNRYGLQDSRSSTGEGRSKDLCRLRDIRRVTSFAVEKNVVGFEDDADELLTKLLGSEARRLVISIYGMGGLGKTTLAGKLYHNDNVRKRFNCRAWVSVSQDYTTRDLLQRIIKSFQFGTIKREELEKMNEEDLELEKMNEDDLERYLHRSLQERSYIVVIDDVWDREAWMSLKRAFPDNENGSRVIITTRNKEVAERSDEITYAHKLRYLRSDESWQLFCEKVCQKINMDEGLEKLGREMVEKCDGLPLAIIVLGGLLSTRKPREWHVVHHQIWRHLKNDSIEISHLLALSFDYLPYQLKQCFLYLGVFPEDFEIDMHDLIHLLVAEGFISQDENRIMEEVATDYLDELINRSLLQVETRCWKGFVPCRVHDLLRDLAIEKAKDFNVLCIYDEDKHSNISSLMSSCPRQAVYSKIKTSSWLEQCNPRLRSLFLSDEEQELVPAVCRKFRYLRVLNVNNGGQRIVTEEIGKLIHLKYLKLARHNLNLHSLSISKLQRLQTLELNVNYDKPIWLPAEIGKLQELRHLIGDYFDGHLMIDSLEKLQTLRYADIETWVKIKSEKLVDLRYLGLRAFPSNVRKEYFPFDSIAKLKSLRILYVNQKGLHFRSFQPLSYCQQLVDLRLRGKIEKLPEDIHKLLPNLECLSLTDTNLKDNPMPLLEKLSNLMILILKYKFYDGMKLICSANGFRQLEILQIEIEELQIQEGALPSLRGLKIPNDCKLVTPETMRSRIQKTLV